MKDSYEGHSWACQEVEKYTKDGNFKDNYKYVLKYIRRDTIVDDIELHWTYINDAFRNQKKAYEWKYRH